MTQDVQQWLAEIKALQQKLAEARQERDEAYASAANWRSLFDTEAQQRRTEAKQAQQQIQALQAEMQDAKTRPTAVGSRTVIEQEVGQIQTVEQLQEKLADALLECGRLTQSLQEEQARHSQTRKSLTTALGDTVDMLTKERSGRERANRSNRSIAAVDSESGESAKIPSPQQPLLDQAQSLV